LKGHPDSQQVRDENVGEAVRNGATKKYEEENLVTMRSGRFHLPKKVRLTPLLRHRLKYFILPKE
jgi:hypothetical protein